MHDNLKIDTHCLVNMTLAAEWKSACATHKDVQVFEKFNVWRDLDLLPDGLRKSLLGKTVGYKEAFAFNSQALTPAWHTGNIHTIKPQQFKRTLRHGLTIQPHVGRFYPRGLVSGVRDVYSEDMHPCRLIEMNETAMTFDFNHPLSQYAMTITVEVNDVINYSGEHGGRCQDVIEMLLRGPGMQARYNNAATKFFSGTPLRRVDEGHDSLFYSLPRMVNHLDKTALEQVENLYASLLQPQSRILDLMASWNSHLSKTAQAAYVAGLGMNQSELDANPALNERTVHDLNQDPRLPFDDAVFDAVICTASVEYLINPDAVFNDVARVLKPGGLFINVFSNRWFPVKAIGLWSEMHEFERMGLVTEYYLQSGRFEDMHTWSLRGLSRPEDDLHAEITQLSDPLYAVWGRVSIS